MFALPPLLLSLLSVLSFTSAQASNNNGSSAVFVYEGDDHTTFEFALNADRSTGDLYFHLSSPAGNAWVGVGIGSNMIGALMFIAYPSSNGEDVTISARVADGHSEPTYQKDIKVEQLGTNAVTGSRETQNIVANGVCRDCKFWGIGGINFDISAQPFIFAVGDVFPTINSDSGSADLSRHLFYGHFTIDMTAATSESGGAVPSGPYVRKDASQATGTKVDDDHPPSRSHGAVMSLVFIVLLPLSSLLLRVWNKVKAHAAVNMIALVFFILAMAGGIVISRQYNRSKNYNSAHQVIGILLLVAFLSQLVLGVLNHRVFKREQKKTIMGKIHSYLGPLIIVFGLANGILGFTFADASFLAIPYFGLILVVAFIYSCIRGGCNFFRKRRADRKNGAGGSYHQPHFGANHGTPQYYPPSGSAANSYDNAPPPYSQPDVPLATYRSSDNVPREDSPAVQPRTMF
ncbi:hypothetical protein LTR37_000274 [Vermiconidia calcicola]|uniref:Uncharacterized protein n=1 Tax=Vermiconidia calcicola TaxID=1690605 RepID=A0ACC3P014_9PEZI|nr:hypothetical protein LTR37_000274 [Vermiconidia calcicola]